MARILKFITERQRQHFSTTFTVFASSTALPQSMDDLLTASAIKKKCVAVSEPHPNGTRFDRVLHPGPQEITLKESEWEYLQSRIRPPAGQWTNFGAEDALEILEFLKEIPKDEESVLHASR